MLRSSLGVFAIAGALLLGSSSLSAASEAGAYLGGGSAQGAYDWTESGYGYVELFETTGASMSLSYGPTVTPREAWGCIIISTGSGWDWGCGYSEDAFTVVDPTLQAGVMRFSVSSWTYPGGTLSAEVVQVGTGPTYSNQNLTPVPPAPGAPIAVYAYGYATAYRQGQASGKVSSSTLGAHQFQPAAYSWLANGTYGSVVVEE